METFWTPSDLGEARRRCTFLVWGSICIRIPLGTQNARRHPKSSIYSVAGSELLAAKCRSRGIFEMQIILQAPQKLFFDVMHTWFCTMARFFTPHFAHVAPQSRHARFSHFLTGFAQHTFPMPNATSDHRCRNGGKENAIGFTVHCPIKLILPISRILRKLSGNVTSREF